MTIRLDRTTTGTVTVDLEYSDDSVLDGPDSATIMAGQRSATVDLEVVNDDDREDAADATVSIDAVSNGVEGGNQSVSISVEDDVAEITFASVQTAVDESDGRGRPRVRRHGRTGQRKFGHRDPRLGQPR